MNFSEPDAMNDVISGVLRYGVVLAAAIIVFGTILLIASYGSSDSSSLLTYVPGRIPHGNFDPNPAALPQGVVALDPFSIIELGVIVLIATPVSRVLFSILLFTAERDATYARITAVVLALLLFSMLVTPFIPLFNA